jgi:zinc D-Ala-D-Ala carboxypeptidase
MATIGISVLFPATSSIAQNATLRTVPSASPTISTGSARPTDAASSLTVVVNKKRPLNPITYAPMNLIKPAFVGGAGVNPYGLKLAAPAASAMVRMAAALKLAGAGVLELESTYRSYADQVAIHDKDVAKFGLVAGENLAARPGYSEHQTGLAADVGAVGQEACRIRVCFAATAPGKWLATNAWQYGFILRYPDGQTATTGYQFEPWHFRYVGVDLSTAMHNAGYKVLENYLKLPAAPTY